MKLGYIICIIAMSAVLLYFILSYLAPDFPSWLDFIAAGIAMMVAMGLKNRDAGGN